MGGNMLKILFILIVGLFGAWSAGVRLHFDALAEWLKAGGTPKTYRKIDLKSGGSLVGEILNEDTNSIRVKVDGGSLTFSRAEISTIAELDSKTMQSGQAVNNLAPNKPIITLRPEDRIFAKKATRKMTVPPTVPVQQSPGPSFPAHAQAVLAQAEQVRGLAAQRQREVEDEVRKMEEGY